MMTRCWTQLLRYNALLCLVCVCVLCLNAHLPLPSLSLPLSPSLYFTTTNTHPQVCFVCDHFGNQTNLQRVREELEAMSDYDLHQICIMYESVGKLGPYKLPGKIHWAGTFYNKI